MIEEVDWWEVLGTAAITFVGMVALDLWWKWRERQRRDEEIAARAWKRHRGE